VICWVGYRTKCFHIRLTTNVEHTSWNELQSVHLFCNIRTVSSLSPTSLHLRWVYIWQTWLTGLSTLLSLPLFHFYPVCRVHVICQSLAELHAPVARCWSFMAWATSWTLTVKVAGSTTKLSWTRDPIRTLRIMLYTCIPVNTFSHVSNFLECCNFHIYRLPVNACIKHNTNWNKLNSKQMLEQRQQ